MVYAANAPMRFDGAPNIRELGGYLNNTGNVLKKHKLLRGGALSGLTAKELEALNDYGIKTCIDLRIAKEKQDGDPFNQSDFLVYHSIPIAGAVDLQCDPKELLYVLYISILEEHRKALLREMQIIAAETEGIIFHCTAGKDRTGLTAMFILSVCGVCEEQIIADYQASAENNREQTRKQLEQLQASGLARIPAEIFESNPQTMRRTLDYLRRNYGSPEGYLREIGVTEKELNAIRKKMLG